MDRDVAEVADDSELRSESDPGDPARVRIFFFFRGRPFNLGAELYGTKHEGRQLGVDMITQGC